MNYLIINGSPRKKNTWKIVNQVKTNLNGNFEEIQLMKENIQICNGCYKCIIESEDKCPDADKIGGILEKIERCDGIIIACPVYAMNVTALLKNLFDHTAFLYHRPKFFTKKALVITTAAGTGQKDVAKYISETLRHWGINKVHEITYACGGKDSIDTENINKISRKFKEDVESNKLHSPKLGDIIFYDVWKAMAVSKNPIEADRKYWFENDLISHDFAPEVKLNILKKAFSKLMFFVMKKVIK